ncbi:MAG: 2'-5' RNA ligase family protein [Actinomycetes bacterium]
MSVVVDGSSAGTADVPAVTIGVAIPVPPPYGDELQRWRAEFGDPMAESIPAHVTLLPPSVVPLAALDDVRAHLHDVARTHDPFDLRLRGTGTFRPVSPVVFVQVAEGVAQCEQLERSVRSGVLARDLSFYYHPHVTVAHHLDETALDHAFDTLSTYEAVFSVTAFSMYEHGTDGVWRPVDVFAFDPVPSGDGRAR